MLFPTLVEVCQFWPSIDNPNSLPIDEPDALFDLHWLLLYVSVVSLDCVLS